MAMAEREATLRISQKATYKTHPPDSGVRQQQQQQQARSRCFQVSISYRFEPWTIQATCPVSYLAHCSFHLFWSNWNFTGEHTAPYRTLTPQGRAKSVRAAEPSCSTQLGHWALGKSAVPLRETSAELSLQLPTAEKWERRAQKA